MCGERLGLGRGSGLRISQTETAEQIKDSGVQQDRYGCGDELHQKAGEAGTGDVGDGLGESQLAVGFHDILHIDERW